MTKRQGEIGPCQVAVRPTFRSYGRRTRAGNRSTDRTGENSFSNPVQGERVVVSCNGSHCNATQYPQEFMSADLTTSAGVKRRSIAEDVPNELSDAKPIIGKILASIQLSPGE
ncbi:hypothetical protein CBL_10715 [Carabus blaptoides fortunei]